MAKALDGQQRREEARSHPHGERRHGRDEPESVGADDSAPCEQQDDDHGARALGDEHVPTPDQKSRWPEKPRVPDRLDRKPVGSEEGHKTEAAIHRQQHNDCDSGSKVMALCS